MRCHPGRWLWGLIPVAMLCWLAVQTERSSIERDLERRSRAALAVVGYDWASVAFDGRDGLLVGQPASPGELEKAAALVRKVWGVRMVRTREQPVAIAEPSRTIADVPITVAVPASAPSMELGDAAPRPIILAPTDHASLQARLATAVAASPAASSAPTHVAAADVAVQPVGEIRASVAPVVGAHDVNELPVAPPNVSSAATKEPQIAVAQSSAGPAAGVETAPGVVPPPEQKPVSPAAKPVSAAPLPAVPEHKPGNLAVEHQGEKPEPSGRSEADAAKHPAPVPLPDKRPASAVPASPAKLAASQPIPELPAHKDAKLAAARAHAEVARVPAPKKSLSASEAAPVTGPSAPAERRASSPPPRFETAALPPGNIAADAGCVDEVQGAAKRVQVHFARGDARLDTPGKALVDGLVTSLNACPGVSLHISGHADASGKARHNKALSERRARSVAAYLIDKGIDARQLIAVGYGDKQPVAPNDTQANRAKNRRIELAITVRPAPVPPMPVRKQGTRNGLSHR